MKDVGFLAGGENATCGLIQRWEAGRPRFMVFTEGIGQDALTTQPLLRDWIARHAKVVVSFERHGQPTDG